MMRRFFKKLLTPPMIVIAALIMFFEEWLWDRLTALIDEREDSLAAYVLEAGSCARRRAAGRHISTQRRTLYIF